MHHPLFTRPPGHDVSREGRGRAWPPCRPMRSGGCAVGGRAVLQVIFLATVKPRTRKITKTIKARIARNLAIPAAAPAIPPKPRSPATMAKARPPDLIVEAEAVRRGAGGWVLDVTVANRGDLTAAAVEVEGVSGGETANATLDYVPGHGSKAAALVFTGDERPRATLRVLGWSSP